MTVPHDPFRGSLLGSAAPQGKRDAEDGPADDGTMSTDDLTALDEQAADVEQPPEQPPELEPEPEPEQPEAQPERKRRRSRKG